MAKEQEKLTQSEIISIEKEIRGYLRCNPKKDEDGKPLGGGFIKGLSEEKKTRCRLLLKKLGRKELKMDSSICIPGMDVKRVIKANLRD